MCPPSFFLYIYILSFDFDFLLLLWLLFCIRKLKMLQVEKIRLNRLWGVERSAFLFIIGRVHTTCALWQEKLFLNRNTVGRFPRKRSRLSSLTNEWMNTTVFEGCCIFFSEWAWSAECYYHHYCILKDMSPVSIHVKIPVLFRLKREGMRSR